MDRIVVVSIQQEILQLHDEFLESFCSDAFNNSYFSFSSLFFWAGVNLTVWSNLTGMMTEQSNPDFFGQ